MLEIISNIFKRYNENEKLAVKDFSNYTLRTFLPNTFLRYNFSTHLNSPEEIWKFFDTMQEFRVNKYFKNDLNDYLTEYEMKAIEIIAINLSNYTKFFNRKTIPLGISQIISSISTLRSLLVKQEELKRKLNIIEIGPGSGMLGLLAKYFEINYTAFDITNAFAIHQTCLYKILFGEDFNDLGSVKNKNYIEAQKLLDKKTSITFLPWWHFLNTDLSLPKYDIIVMNHCFFEIQKKALQFIFNRLGSHLERQLVICSYWGSNKFNNYTQDDLVAIEEENNIKHEIIFSSNDIYIPKTIALFSYNLNKNPKDFNFLEQNINCRLGFENYQIKLNINFLEKLKIFTRKILPKLVYITLSLILNKIFRKKKYPLVIGKNYYKIHNENIQIFSNNKYSNIKISFDQFLSRVRKIEKSNNKPSFTEDELFGNYINSKRHS